MSAPSVIVYGGNGALGKAVVSLFKKQNWKVISIDLGVNGEADSNLTVSPADSWEAQSAAILSGAEKLLSGGGGGGGGEKVKSVICVAGGWAGGGVAAADVIKSSELMWKQSVHSSLISAQLASKFLAEGGMLHLTGANAALQGTPGMVGYGMAKAAVHQLVKSLASEGSGLPNGVKVNALLPITLDTPANRGAMPNADFSSWTPLDTLAQKYFDWASGASSFNSGDLIVVSTKGGVTTFAAHQ